MMSPTDSATGASPAAAFPAPTTNSVPLRLRFRGGLHDGQVLRIQATKCTIGSSPQTTLRITYPGVHPIHCVILNGGGTAAIRSFAPDTLLNNAPFELEQLHPGDVLSLGPIHLEVLPPAGTAGPAKETVQPVQPEQVQQATDAQAVAARTNPTLTPTSAEARQDTSPHLAPTATAEIATAPPTPQTESHDEESALSQLEAMRRELHTVDRPWANPPTQKQPPQREPAHEFASALGHATELVNTAVSSSPMTAPLAATADPLPDSPDTLEQPPLHQETLYQETPSQALSFPQDPTAQETNLATETPQRNDPWETFMQNDVSDTSWNTNELSSGEDDRPSEPAVPDQQTAAAAVSHSHQITDQPAALQPQVPQPAPPQPETVAQAATSTPFEAQPSPTPTPVFVTDPVHEAQAAAYNTAVTQDPAAASTPQTQAESSRAEALSMLARLRAEIRQSTEALAAGPLHSLDASEESEEPADETENTDETSDADSYQPSVGPTVPEEIEYSAPENSAPVDTAAILAKFGHSMEAVEDEQPAPPRPPQPSSHATNDAHDEEDDEAIQDYMAQLMQRVGGGGAVPTNEDKKVEHKEQTSSSTTSFSSTSSSAQSRQPQQPVAPAVPEPPARPLDPSEFVPRAVAPEASSGLKALRAVANTSTRSAIDRHRRRSLDTKAIISAFIALVAFGVSVAMGYLALNAESLVSLPMFLCLSSGFCGVLAAVKALAYSAMAALSSRRQRNLKQLSAR